MVLPANTLLVEVLPVIMSCHIWTYRSVFVDLKYLMRYTLFCFINLLSLSRSSEINIFRYCIYWKLSFEVHPIGFTAVNYRP